MSACVRGVRALVFEFSSLVFEFSSQSSVLLVSRLRHRPTRRSNTGTRLIDVSRSPCSMLQNVEDNERAFGVPIFVMHRDPKNNELSSQDIKVLIGDAKDGTLSLRDLSTVSKNECCRWQRIKGCSVRLVSSSMMYIVRSKHSKGGSIKDLRVSSELKEDEVRINPEDLESHFPDTSVFFGFQSVTSAMNRQLTKKSPPVFEPLRKKGGERWQNIPNIFLVGTTRVVRFEAYLPGDCALQKDEERKHSLSSRTVAKVSFDHILDEILDCKYEALTRYRTLRTKGTMSDIQFRVRYSIRKDVVEKGDVYSSSSPTSSSSSKSSMLSSSSSSKIDEEDTKRVVISSSKTKESQSCVEDWHIRSFFGGL